jgi:hypothetical protein
MAAFENLQTVFPAEAVEVLDYFEDVYLGRVTGRQGQCRPPIFPISMWNMNDRLRI